MQVQGHKLFQCSDTHCPFFATDRDSDGFFETNRTLSNGGVRTYDFSLPYIHVSTLYECVLHFLLSTFYVTLSLCGIYM